MDDDAEFRDIIVQNLEQKGVLQKMRAQIRAHIYHLIEEDRTSDAHTIPTNNSSPISEATHPADTSIRTPLDPYSSTVDDVIALSLVQDLLDCLQLSYTSSMLKSEVKCRTNLNWSRRKIANVLQLDVDDNPDANGSNSSATTNRQDYSEDTFNEISNGSINDPSDSGKIENGNELISAKASNSVQTVSKPNNKTPLLVEILRRLPKTTDDMGESSRSNKSSNETSAGDVNNETFVTASRLTNSNQLSESF